MIALCLGSLLAACGQVGASRATVSLLPDAAATGESWSWTAECPFSPSASRDCARSGPDLGSAQLNGDEWNLGGGSTTPGSVRMSVSSPGGLVVQGNLPGAPPCTQSTCLAPSAYTWVRGYPDVLYGINQCHADTSPPQSRRLPLPMRVGAIPPDLIGTTAYSSRTSHVVYDVAYDMWLNGSDTRRPCRTEGTVEVMVWTDYDDAALPPPGEMVGTASVPFAVDGAHRRGGHAWSIYVSNIGEGGHTAPWGGTIWMVLDKADVVRSGTVSVDLSSALSAVGSLLRNNYGWGDFQKSYWLDTLPFGMEYGPEGALAGAGPADFTLNLSSYCLDVEAEPSGGAC
ncbi:MAG TPA: hypothetical protein VN796_01135 [Acidimicrobiales bacterium]|nr:hypothetical protein [Acidimicrobiales bacterium]